VKGHLQRLDRHRLPRKDHLHLDDLLPQVNGPQLLEGHHLQLKDHLHQLTGLHLLMKDRHHQMKEHHLQLEDHPPRLADPQVIHHLKG
jgi:hypothetical protein